MSRLQESIERLYAAFGDMPKPRLIEGCPCCIDSKEVDTLVAMSVRAIPPDILGPYASSALLTVGSVSDYLYFLPRILEITATNDSWWPGPEVTARAIRSSGLDNWPSARREALLAYFDAVFTTIMERRKYDKLDGWLCAIARMGLEVDPYLKQISNAPAAVLAYFEVNTECLPQRKLSNAFWELPCKGHDDIVNWFYSDDIRKMPFDAYGYVL